MYLKGVAGDVAIDCKELGRGAGEETGERTDEISNEKKGGRQ